MKTCEYMQNLIDIKYVQTLILNETISKKIEIRNYLDKGSYMYYSLSVDSTYYYGWSIYTALKVRLRDIKYPYFVLADTEKYPYIWEGKTANIYALRNIQLMFN